MDVKLINPLLKSVRGVIETMLRIAPGQSAPYAKKSSLASGDIAGVIGFAEIDCNGAVVLSFPKSTALKVYRLLTGEESSRLDGDVQDAIGEITNMAAGGAKSGFANNNRRKT